MNDRAQNHTATIAECITQLLKKMQIDATVEEGLIVDTVTLTVRTPEAGLLIGDEGQHLFAFNYLLKKIVERQLPEAPHFIVDVNDTNGGALKSCATKRAWEPSESDILKKRLCLTR